MKNKIILIVFLLSSTVFGQVPMFIQGKLTNINSFPSIDIGVNTNVVKTELNEGIEYGITNNDGDFYSSLMFFADKKFGGVSDQMYKKFIWNGFSLGTKNDKIYYFNYGFYESSMNFEDAVTVRSQGHYEKKLPIVMGGVYTNYGTNYQIKRVKNSYDDKKNRVDAILYWQKSDGRVYSFSYTRMANVSATHQPLYEYMGFETKADFDAFIKMRNGDSLPADAPSLATLTAEHKALEQQYGLVDQSDAVDILSAPSE